MNPLHLLWIIPLTIFITICSMALMHSASNVNKCLECDYYQYHQK